MGDVHSRRTPPFPSPTETVSPVAVPQPHNLQVSRSSSTCRQSYESEYVTGISLDGLTRGVDTSLKEPARKPHFSRGDSAEQVVGLTPVTEDHQVASDRPEDQGRSSQTLKQLRRQMEELLVYQQMQQTQNQHSSLTQTGNSSSPPTETPRKRRLSNSSTADTPVTIVQPSSGSIGSGGTVTGVDNSVSADQIATQTPSYPFPREQNQVKPSKAAMEKSGPQGQFRLKFPADRLRASPVTHTPDGKPTLPKLPGQRPHFGPPLHDTATEDAEVPTPNLYDLTLKLNADPGLEAWWTNLIEILQAHYGAERVTLAVPGDATDLENVPWGQKAIFNGHAEAVTNNGQTLPPQVGSAPETKSSRTMNSDELGHRQEQDSGFKPKTPGPAPLLGRPALESRHSFAGFPQNKKHRAMEMDRQQHLPKSNAVKQEKKHARIAEQSELVGSHNDFKDWPRNSLDPIRQAVFPIPRPLENESDPLIKRTGVVKLFGRSNPIVLTREYTEHEPTRISQPSDRAARSPLETVQVTPGAEVPGEHQSIVGQQRNLIATNLREFDEYEQIPQSPWSQSPAPSPAPRTHADSNPFFTSHTVDEMAFAKNPPEHDYSNVQPLEAIGIDYSKTVVHVPLLHGGQSNHGSSSTLRFPVAIVSLLSTIVPYPSNLRQSLSLLMPHLTTSFCLAQQYSQLERQITSKVEAPRYGHLLGLGGTFSDASSELELVAGLSGHVGYSVGDESSMSARASLTSPSDRSSTKYSPAVSNMGTPGFDLGQLGLGSNNQSPALRSSDISDGYFNVQNQQSKLPRDNIPQQRHRLSKSTVNTDYTERTAGKLITSEENTPQDPNFNASPLNEMRPPSAFSPTQQPSRQASTNSFYNQLQRDLTRPIPDTIAQLMLNSVPLHLFLAKPQSGEMIWTSTKFDAYRRSKPQEQKLRDPWQNIHNSERDHVSSEWANALRTGSQFTERVRVRRFNDETAYRWFIFRANPLLSATGEVLYWIGSFLDIHEQHISELKATQEREKFATDAKYRAFSNSIPQVVFEATENRGLIFVNEQWNLYTGQNLAEALDLGFAKHVHPDDLEKCGGISSQTTQSPNDTAPLDSSLENHGVSSALDELVRRGVASLQRDENGRVFYSTEIRLRSRGGDFRWHLVRLVCVETSSFGSEEASWYGTCTDINDRKNLERELNKAMSQLNNQMESKTKFFSNMSHEIRTPLNGILGTIPFILDTQLDSDQRRMLDTIQNSSTNLRELVDNILDVSRVEAGKMSMVNSWFHVRSMIEDVIDTIASRAIDKGLEINYLMEADVPAMMIGDRFRIRQVLINLVGNAVKFTSQGEVYICCSLHRDTAVNFKETEALLNFDVIDTGKGFSSKDAERLMQRFSQLGESGSQQNAGSGLGLFLSKQLVEMHGGSLTPSSKEGQGAKFSFNVRVDAPPPPSPSERPQLLRQASTASRRPVGSRTTSYDRSSLQIPKTFEPKLQDPTALSPDLDSPTTQSPIDSGGLNPPSAMSSALPTPDVSTSHMFHQFGQEHKSNANTAIPSPEGISNACAHQTPSPSEGASVSGKLPVSSPGFPSQGPFSIVILCPLDNTRKATQQHIEKVVPHEIQFKITILPDVDELKDVTQGHGAKCTHLVLNLPATDDILEVIQQVSEIDANTAPVVVIISDLYQKRQISTRVKELAATGKQVFIVPKPVKPSAFSTIFDPDSKRELSKDRNQDMAREINNNFKTVSKMVKEVLGNKGYRILLVEDDETNRDVRIESNYPKQTC